MPINDYFKCLCGRTQPFAPHDAPGGITRREAEVIGWHKKGQRWICPFCSNDTRNLRRAFKADAPIFSKKGKNKNRSG